jgi:hypothetical protein
MAIPRNALGRMVAPSIVCRPAASPSTEVYPPHCSLFSDQKALTNIRRRAEQDQHWCRSTSAPVLNRFYLVYSSVSSFFYLSMGASGGWAASLHRPNPSSGISDPRFRLTVTGGSVVASMANRPP